jgi:hypothetical protein
MGGIAGEKHTSDVIPFRLPMADRKIRLPHDRMNLRALRCGAVSPSRRFHSPGRFPVFGMSPPLREDSAPLAFFS